MLEQTATAGSSPCRRHPQVPNTVFPSRGGVWDAMWVRDARTPAGYQVRTQPHLRLTPEITRNAPLVNCAGNPIYPFRMSLGVIRTLSAWRAGVCDPRRVREPRTPLTCVWIRGPRVAVRTSVYPHTRGCPSLVGANQPRIPSRDDPRPMWDFRFSTA